MQKTPQQHTIDSRSNLTVRVLSGFVLAFSLSAMGQSDDFNDGNDTAPPPAWQRYNPIGAGAWSFPGGNTYRIQSATSPNPAIYGQARAGSLLPVTYTNFYVAADIVGWDDTIHQVCGVMARIGNPGPGTTTGYMFTHDRGNPSVSGGDMDIVRVDAEAATSLPTTGADSIWLDPTKSYRFVFIGVGTNLIGQVFQLPDTNVPVVQITATDAAYAQGMAGLVVANNNGPTYEGPADATFDNFVAAPADVWDNFNDGNDSSPPPGWVRYNPIATGSYSFPGGNTYRIQSAPSPNPAIYGQGRAGAYKPTSFADFYMSADIIGWDDSIHQISGVMARLGNIGPGTTGGYLFSHDRGDPASSTSGDMDIVRLDNEVPTVLNNTSGNDAIHFVPGKSYRLVFIGVGPDFRGQVFELPDLTRPVVDITASDNTGTPWERGAAGLLVANNDQNYDGPADTTFDNFLLTSVEPRLTIGKSGTNVVISWPQVLPFTLESTAGLAPASWTAVTTGITASAGVNMYSAPPSGSAALYRLVYR